MTSMENCHSQKCNQRWYDVHHMSIYLSTMPDLQKFFQLIPPPIELCFEIIKSLRWCLIQLPWESGRAMRKIIFCGKRRIRIIVVADWLDNRHMPPLQVLDSTLYLQKFKIGVSCIIVSNYFLFSPVLSVIICWRVDRFLLLHLLDPSCTSSNRGFKRMTCWILWEKNTTF